MTWWQWLIVGWLAFDVLVVWVMWRRGERLGRGMSVHAHSNGDATNVVHDAPR